jgi:hypothetical protein
MININVKKLLAFKFKSRPSGKIKGIHWELISKNYAGNIYGDIYRYDFKLTRYKENGNLLKTISEFTFSYSQDIKEIAERLIPRINNL